MVEAGGNQASDNIPTRELDFVAVVLPLPIWEFPKLGDPNVVHYSK